MKHVIYVEVCWKTTNWAEAVQSVIIKIRLEKESAEESCTCTDVGIDF